MRNFKIKFSFFILSVFSLGTISMAQECKTDTFKLVKIQSHYTFSARINNGAAGTFLLESGIHVMLIDSLFAFNNLPSLNLDFIRNDKNEKMNLGGKVYTITHKAKGKIHINDHTLYEGEIFVLPGYKSTYEIAIPIQKLYNHSDKKNSIIKLDLTNENLYVLNRKEFKKEEHDYSKVKMNFSNYLNMPAIKTKLRIAEGDKIRTLSGNFNLDLGNASFVFLFQQNKAVQSFLKTNSDLKLQKAYNKKGMLIAEATVVKECELCNLKFENSIIAITKALPRFTTEGSIGLKFFEKATVIFDFTQSNFYLKDK